MSFSCSPNTYYNDVSMIINGKLIVLVEHQSTINENMPLRFLDYVVRLYEKNVKQENRYKRKLVQIPTPEFYVFYNGTAPYPEFKTLRLSDAYIQQQSKPQLELTIDVYNIADPHPEKPTEIVLLPAAYLTTLRTSLNPVQQLAQLLVSGRKSSSPQRK